MNQYLLDVRQIRVCVENKKVLRYAGENLTDQKRK